MKKVILLTFLVSSFALSQISYVNGKFDTLKTRTENGWLRLKAKTQIDSPLVLLTPLARAYSNAKIARINGLSDSSVTFRIDTTSTTGAPAYSASSPNIDLRLPFDRMKDTSWSRSVSDIASVNSFLTIATAGKKKSLTSDTTKYATSAMTGWMKYSDFARTAFKNESNGFSSGTTQTMPRAVVDSSLTVFGFTPKLNSQEITLEVADTINTSTYDAFGIIVRFLSGKYGIIYREGTSHAGDCGTIKMRKSNDEAFQWGDATSVASLAGKDLRNVSGIVTSSGRLLIFYTVYDTVLARQTHIYYTYSDKEGEAGSFSTPVLFSTISNRGSNYGGITRIAGDTLMVGWFQYNTLYTDSVAFSADDGETWINRTMVDTSSSLQFVEPAFAYSGARRIVGLMRLNSGTTFYQVKSTDNGRTWSRQDSTDFDSWTDPSPAWLTTYYGVDGKLRVDCHYVNRNAEELRSVTAIATDLIDDGVVAWQIKTLRTIQSTTPSQQSGYPSVIHPFNDNRAVGWFYDEKSSSDADITIFTDIKDYIEFHPTSALYVDGTGSAGQLSLDYQNGSTTTGGTAISLYANANVAGLVSNWYYVGADKYSRNGGASQMYFDVTTGSTAGDIVFRTIPNGTAGATHGWNERLRLKENGRLGLGTAYPDSLFTDTAGVHIYGGALIEKNLAVNGTATIGGNLILTQTTSPILTNTADASDNKRIVIGGGGAAGQTRGGHIYLHGNEYGSSNDGEIILIAGDVTNGWISMRTGASLTRFIINESGATTFGSTDGTGSLPIYAGGLSSFDGTNSGRVTVGAGDSVQVSVTGFSTSGEVQVSYYGANSTFTKHAHWGYRRADGFTIYGDAGAIVSYWISKK